MLIETRSGTNLFHGTLFDYFRNDKLDANNWFANRSGLPRPALRQNDFGGVLGGPVLLPKIYNGTNRTFFFVSYEGLRLRQPRTGTSLVPSQAIRAAVIPSLRPFMNSYPIPNGKIFPNGSAEFVATYSDPSSSDTTGIRIDQAINDRLRFFGRYSHAPSNARLRAGGDASSNSLATVNAEISGSDVVTAGATLVFTPRLVNDFRFNWTRSTGSSVYQSDSFGGATPLRDSDIFPASITAANGNVYFDPTETGVIQYGANAKNTSTQLNFLDSIALNLGTHSLRFGFDYRHVVLVGNDYAGSLFAYLPTFDGLGTVGGGPQPGTVLSGITDNNSLFGNFRGSVLTQNVSVYAQDNWRVNRRLSLTYGLRWDVNPAPTGTNGTQLLTLNQTQNPSGFALAPAGTSYYATTFRNFAPRLGASYQMRSSPGRELVLRGGGGLFYDLGYGLLGAAINTFPYLRELSQTGVAFPLNSQYFQPVPFTTAYPATEIYVADAHLKLPLTYQWNVTAEQALGRAQTMSVGYVGAIGRRLIRSEYYRHPNENIVNANINRNAATSDYHALQAQFRRRFSKGFQALASYSWSHSIDEASSDANIFAGTAFNSRNDRGSYDFDLRHVFTTALTYAVPKMVNRSANAVLGGWAADLLVTAQSAPPVNLRGGFIVTGSFNRVRPDVVGGQSLYLADANAPGERRFNPAAFASPINATGDLRQGTLGRNVLRGFPLNQTDLALRRDFSLRERLHLQVRAEAFNLFNHANFASPEGNIASALFGVSTQTYNQGMGTGGVAHGLSPLYQAGGPRSLQVALKLVF